MGSRPHRWAQGPWGGSTVWPSTRSSRGGVTHHHRSATTPLNYRKAQAARACVTCGPCSARRHWQQAASNDALAPALHRDNVPPCDHQAALAGAGPLFAVCEAPAPGTRKRASPPVRPGAMQPGCLCTGNLREMTTCPRGARTPIQDRRDSTAGNDCAAFSCRDGTGQGAFTELSLDDARWGGSRGSGVFDRDSRRLRVVFARGIRRAIFSETPLGLASLAGLQRSAFSRGIIHSR